MRKTVNIPVGGVELRHHLFPNDTGSPASDQTAIEKAPAKPLLPKQLKATESDATVPTIPSHTETRKLARRRIVGDRSTIWEQARPANKNPNARLKDYGFTPTED